MYVFIKRWPASWPCSALSWIVYMHACSGVTHTFEQETQDHRIPNSLLGMIKDRDTIII